MEAGFIERTPYGLFVSPSIRRNGSVTPAAEVGG